MENWDTYNSKLKEAEEEKELASENLVKQVILENNIFSIIVSQWKEEYKADADVSALFTGEKRFVLLGKIEGVNAKELKILVRCETDDIISDYFKNSIKKIQKIRIVDYGTIVRLKRQREAMKKLFQEETVNPNLKEILMGNYEFKQPGNSTAVLEYACSLFGTNVKQKEAFTGAVNAADIYLIQGPPGTGKTTIITEIVKYAIEQNLCVLVAPETNIAVNNVLEKVQNMEQVIPVRLGGEERIGEECKPFNTNISQKQFIENIV